MRDWRKYSCSFPPKIALTLSVRGEHDCTRAKAVGRLPQELRLTLFPHGKTANVQGSLAQQKMKTKNMRTPDLRKSISRSSLRLGFLLMFLLGVAVCV